jgi:hypothetical protein
MDINLNKKEIAMLLFIECALLSIVFFNGYYCGQKKANYALVHMVESDFLGAGLLYEEECYE